MIGLIGAANDRYRTGRQMVRVAGACIVLEGPAGALNVVSQRCVNVSQEINRRIRHNISGTVNRHLVGDMGLPTDCRRFRRPIGIEDHGLGRFEAPAEPTPGDALRIEQIAPVNSTEKPPGVKLEPFGGPPR